MRLNSKWLTFAILPVVALMFAPKASADVTTTITQPAAINQQPFVNQTMNQPGMIDPSLVQPTVDQSLVQPSVNSMLTQPAVIDNSAVLNGCEASGVITQPAISSCNTCGVLTQPAVVNSCDTCGAFSQPVVLTQPAVIDSSCNTCGFGGAPDWLGGFNGFSGLGEWGWF